MMQTLAFNTVDVFTTRPFSGNSLALVHNADALTDQQMQLLAREFNLPETLFIQSADDSANTAKVRIFTPTDEIPFAGHPTIGCAIYLAEQLHINSIGGDQGAIADNGADFSTDIRLEEVAGLVPVHVERKQGQIAAQLVAPVIPTPITKADFPDAMALDATNAAKAISVAIGDIDTDKAPPMSHTGGPTFLFISLNNLQALSKACAIEPICTQLSHAYSATGVYIYYLNEDTREIDARMFAPASGIPEDPATGSATAILASQLQMSKQLGEGKNQFNLRQGYDMGRPSDLLLDIDVDNAQIKSVKVSGSSIGISSGHVRIPD